ncbi:MAG: DUF2388 domain-containing protein [Paucimonas sp.]|nr:DUF2388 domain-containing protein [Paucimonas sp.]
MKSWICGGCVALLMLSTQVAAHENADSSERAMMMTVLIPSMLVVGTTGLTVLAPEIFKPAKDDALALIASDGQIHGAQFEQATQYYHANCTPPYVSDQQLALAIVSTY